MQVPGRVADREVFARFGKEEDEAVALARVFCGVTAADVAPWLTVAVVDDAGRLQDLRHVSDDPAGFAQLGGLLADHSGGLAPVAVDRPAYVVAQLIAAAGQLLALAEDTAAADFAERFADDTSYDEIRAPLDQRRAIGLARALQSGRLAASPQRPSWNLDELKPMLAAHGAIATSRQAAAAALREVLRELYPAALRAYADPAEFVPLRILDALPESSMLTSSPSARQRDAALVDELVATGVTDQTNAVQAISALHIAVEETPRWGHNRQLAPVVAETVRQAIAAVRACDSASSALVLALGERLNAVRAGAGAPTRPYLVPDAPASPAHRRGPGPAAEVPASRLSPRESGASAAAAGVPGPSAPQTLDELVTTLSFSLDPLNAPLSPAPPAYPTPAPPAPPPYPTQAPTPARTAPPAYPTPAQDYRLAAAAAATTPPAAWHDLRFPPEPPPPLRLVDQPPAEPSRTVDPLTDPIPVGPPVLRVIDGERGRRAAGGPGADGDLLIFSEAQQTAWFTAVDEQALAEEVNWGRLADDGWRAAEQLVHPTVGTETSAGLPRRVPQANLVPGSAQPPPRQLHIVRDAHSIAAHTEGYFRGWRRGQEIGGFAVGQRDRAAWEFNRDQRARLS